MLRKHRIFILLSLTMLALVAVLSQPVQAQEPVPTPSDDDVNRVAKQMYCPVCENIPLDVCPTQACSEWRELIRLRLSEGWSDQQIKDYFVAQYGDRVLSEPPRRGWNWLVYVLPWVFVAIGAVVVWRVLVSMRQKAALANASTGTTDEPAPPLSPDTDPYLARIEEELKQSEKS